MDFPREAARRLLPSPVRHTLHRWLVQRKIKMYVPRVVKRSYAGQELHVSLRDPLAEGWYDHDWGEQPEIDLLCRGRLTIGARVFDLGAHQAVVALILSRIVGQTGHVVAVEAERHNVDVARENVRLNDAHNVTVVHAAAADEPGRLYFAESLNGSVTLGGQRGTVAVDAVTVDGLADQFGTPDVVFIDVEGYEANVLAGATRTLQCRATDFFVEVHDLETLARAGSNADEVVRAFARHGYTCRAAPADSRVTGDWCNVTDGLSLAGRRSFLVAVAE